MLAFFPERTQPTSVHLRLAPLWPGLDKSARMRGVDYDVDDCVHRILIAKSNTVCNGLSSTTSDLEGICCDVEAVQQCDDFSGLTKREPNSTAPISLCRWFLRMPPLVPAGVEKEMSHSTGEARGLGMKDTVRAILSAPRRTYMRAAPHRSKDAVSLDSLSNGVDSLSEKIAGMMAVFSIYLTNQEFRRLFSQSTKGPSIAEWG